MDKMGQKSQMEEGVKLKVKPGRVGVSPALAEIAFDTVMQGTNCNYFFMFKAWEMEPELSEDDDPIVRLGRLREKCHFRLLKDELVQNPGCDTYTKYLVRVTFPDGTIVDAEFLVKTDVYCHFLHVLRMRHESNILMRAATEVLPEGENGGELSEREEVEAA